MKGLLCFQRTNLQTGQKLTALIDIGAKNNYISLQAATNAKQIPLSKATTVKTIHGISKITSYIQINIFSRDIKFLVLKDAGNFDLIFGMNGLEKINAILSFTTLEMSYTTLPDHTKPRTKKICQTDHNGKVQPKKTNTRINNPTISKRASNQSGTQETGITTDQNKLKAKNTPDNSKEAKFNRNQKIEQKEINRNQPSTRIDRTKPKFKMKLFLLERFLSDLYHTDRSSHHGL